jgi:two-component system, NtrC family, response regulator AtoC
MRSLQPLSSTVLQPTQTLRLLVVTRDTAALRRLWSMVESNSWQLETAAGAWEALERIQSGVAPHLLILDLPRGDRDALHILLWLRRLRPDLPTILLCHTLDADTQKDAIRMGADDVLVRPLQDEHLRFAIHRYLGGSTDFYQPTALTEVVEPLDEEGFFVIASPLMRKVRAHAELLSQTDVPVMILGEKGSGRATVARLIHRLSVRSGFKFVKVNGTGLPEDILEQDVFGIESVPTASSSHPIAGKLETAEKGTILFEDLSEISDDLQIRLLRVLQDGNFTRCGGSKAIKTTIRILASNTPKIEEALAQKKLREDLYYRLSAFTLRVPPLRQRKEEIRIFMRYFMHSLARYYGLPAREFSPRVIESCEKYWWPGNVKELEAFVKRYLVAGESELVLNELKSRGQMDTLPGLQSSEIVFPSAENGKSGYASSSPQSLRSLIRNIKSETERNAIGVALEKTGWNRKAAARLLQVSYRALLYKIEQYKIRASESFLSPLAAGQKSGVDTKGKAS